jgi:hypothetical protein
MSSLTRNQKIEAWTIREELMKFTAKDFTLEEMSYLLKMKRCNYKKKDLSVLKKMKCKLIKQAS